MKKEKFILLAAALLIIILLAAVIYPRLSSTYTDSQQFPESSTEAASDFTVYDTAGNTVSLSEQTGKPVVVNFWATWCGYCMEELPAFNHMAKKYGNNIQFMMVDLTDGVQETPETSMAFIKEQGYTFPVFMDNDQSAVAAYGITSIPVTLFIDAEGNLFHKQMGAMNEKTLEENILSLVNKTAPKQETPTQEAGCSFH